MNETGFDFEGFTLGKGKGKEHIRDVFYEGRCDDGVLELAKGMGWEDKLLKKHKDLMNRMDKEAKAAKSSAPAEAKADQTAKVIAADVQAEKREATREIQTSTKGDDDSADAVADGLAQLGIGEGKEGVALGKSNNDSSL